MGERSRPFQNAVEEQAPTPRSAVTRGLEFIDADGETGTVELAFAATEDFASSAGSVLGAFVAATPHDTVGPALPATLGPDQFRTTPRFDVSFLWPVRPGRVVGRGRVVRRDETMAYLAASLLDSDEAVIAAATATACTIDPLGQRTNRGVRHQVRNAERSFHHRPSVSVAARMRSTTPLMSGATMSGRGPSGLSTAPGRLTKAALHPALRAPVTSHE